jgi:hypothetical protein
LQDTLVKKEAEGAGEEKMQEDGGGWGEDAGKWIDEGEGKEGMEGEGGGREREGRGDEGDDSDATCQDDDGYDAVGTLQHCSVCHVSSLDANIEEDDMYPNDLYCNTCWEKQLDLEEGGQDCAGKALSSESSSDEEEDYEDEYEEEGANPEAPVLL